MPYNPGLVNQMAFYSRRMREEAAIRRTGLVFIVLAFTIQFFAVLSPPQPTVANSSNDLINGGISSAANAAAHCRSNTKHFKQILAYYGISCDTVAKATTVTLNSNNHNGHLYSMGWNPQGAKNDNTGKATNEQPVNVTGAGKVYWRKLNSWDSYASGSNYQALKLTNSQGKLYYILYNCGNLVSVTIPSPVPQHEVCPWRSDRWTTSPDCFEPCQYNKSIPKNDPRCKPTPTIITDPVRPEANCPLDGNLKASDPLCKACPYNGSLLASNANCVPPEAVCQHDPTIKASDPACPRCEYNNLISANNPDCRPCDKNVSNADELACIVPHKTASNITQGLADANNTTAAGGDVIKYVISVKNEGKKDIKDFIFEENLNDVMDYADITDLHGGSLKDGIATWPKEIVKAGATVQHEITVKIKTPIPQTPASTSDPAHFDLTMTNVYGDSINIKLPGSAIKTIESTTVQELPNAGPGTTLAIIGAIAIVGSYLYYRSRLLAKESTLALQEMATT